MADIILTIRITGETADHYSDVHPDLIFEDFVGRHNDSDVEFVSLTKASQQKPST